MSPVTARTAPPPDSPVLGGGRPAPAERRAPAGRPVRDAASPRPARSRPVRPGEGRRPDRAADARRRPAGRPSPRPAAAPLPVRVLLLPVRLALVPLALALHVMRRATGGRPWLPLILLAGCGIIALHATTLQLNRTIAERDVDVAKLERSTATLRSEVSRLGAPDRITRAAGLLGMVPADPQGVSYLSSGDADAAKAAKMVVPPNATWQPSPNPSAQNGDAPDADGDAATGAGPATGTGVTGASPTAGVAGATGTTGTTGPEGATGTTGATGTDGATGTTGAEGTAGGEPPAGTGAGTPDG